VVIQISHVLSLSVASIEQANAAMPPTIAHRRGLSH
jgi:hypothetical protein